MIEQSEIALENINKNISLHKCNKNVSCHAIDILKHSPSSKYDVIVCNPPYIDINGLNDLEYEVKWFDPHDALTDYSDGLTFYRRIYHLTSTILNKDGIILFEIGTQEQIKFIKEIFKEYDITIHKDLNDDKRILELYNI